MELSQIPATAGLSIIIGLLLIFLGRRIFWIFVGGVGFLTGLQLAPAIVPGQSEMFNLLIGIALGIVGAVLAIVLQRVAVAVAGWIAGGLLAVRLAAMFGWNDPAFVWGAWFIGAIIAAVIVSLLFDWAVIVLTTLSGAVLVCDRLTFSPTVVWSIGVALVIAGLLVQARDFAGIPAMSRTGNRL